MSLSPNMPDYGVYLVWPCEGNQWIHVDDVAIVEHLIPSNRVFRRSLFDGEYYHLNYGDQRLRVRPTMWLQVPDEGLWIGDQIEIIANFYENEPCIGKIVEMRLDQNLNRILYSIESREQILPRNYLVEELKQLHQHVQLRESDFRSSPVINPTNLDGDDYELSQLSE